MASRRSSSLVAETLALVSLTTAAHAAVIDANPSNYEALIPSLAPGDTLRLAAGTYTQGMSFAGVAGTAARPIVVTGPADQSAVFTARDCCNTIQLDGTSFLQVMNLTLDGGGRAGPAGVDSRGVSHHIVLENLKIVGHNGSPQTAAISTAGAASNWIIRHDVILGAGTGLHLGSADDAQPFVAGVIEHNVMLNTAGSDLELAPSADSAAGDAPTVIRYNVFSKHGPTANDDAPTIKAASASDPRKLEVYGNVMAAAAAAPTLTLTASPTNVAAGGTSTLSWTTTGVDACSASSGWMGTKASNGSETVGPVQSTTSFQLTCLGPGGNANAIVQVTVGGSTSPPPSTPPPDTSPTPPTTPPPSSGNPGSGSGSGSSSGGGGGVDALTIGFLTLFFGLRRRRAGARPGPL